MNKYLLIFLYCLVIQSVHALPVKKGDRHFKKSAYHTAAETYRKALNKSTQPEETATLHYKLGVSLLKMNQIPEATSHLQQAIQGGIHTPECLQAYATVCQLQGDYNKAIEYLEKSTDTQTRTSSITAQINSCRYALEHSAMNPAVSITPVRTLNTNGSEYGIGYYQNGSLLYSSTASPDSLDKHSISERTGQGFSRLYIATRNDSTFHPGTELKYASSTYGNDGGLAYDPSSDKLYCTRFEINGAGYFIYRATIHANKIFESSGFHLPKTISNFGHPAFTADGKRLYFTSTMPGGQGQADIWYIEQDKNGKWGDPQNAGPEVNSPGDEVFPYVRGNQLYFSSNYHPGLGGLDLFSCTIEGEKHLKRLHLQAPFNSSYDDFNLILENDTCGLFVSNRNIGFSDDILGFRGKITTESNALPIVPDTTPLIVNLPLIAEKTDSLPQKETARATQKTTFVLHDIYYEFGKSVLLNSSKKRLDEIIALLQQYQAMTLSVASHTDSRGEAGYNQTLSEKRANAVVDYLTQNGIDRSRIQSQGHGESQPLILKARTEQEHLQNRRTVFTLSTDEHISRQLHVSRDSSNQPASLLSEGLYVRIACGFDKTKRQKACGFLRNLREQAEIIENLEKGGWNVYLGPLNEDQAETLPARCRQFDANAGTINSHNQ